MGRKPRVHVPGGFYHAIMRGNDRQPVFFGLADRDRWEHCVVRAIRLYGASVHAFCWMTNHVHLLVQVGTLPLSRIMQHAVSTYARTTNCLQGRRGHLFERRYHAALIRDDAYLLSLVRYIHNNPVKAQLVEVPDKYVWSSHRAYLGETKCDWLHTEFVLSLFSERRSVAVACYRAFMDEEEATDSRFEDAAPAGTGGQPVEIDSGDYGDFGKRQWNQGDSMESIAHRHCVEHGLSVAQLTGPSRARALAKARTDIAIEALDNGVANLAEISRWLNRSEATVCEAVQRRRKGKT